MEKDTGTNVDWLVRVFVCVCAREEVNLNAERGPRWASCHHYTAKGRRESLPGGLNLVVTRDQHSSHSAALVNRRPDGVVGGRGREEGGEGGKGRRDAQAQSYQVKNYKRSAV